MSEVRSPDRGDSHAAPLVAAVLINVAMGVIYVWSLFLLPLETFLARPRADLSIVASVALVAFTIGVVVHDRLLKRLGSVRFTALAFACAAGGHLLFAVLATYPGLVLGYGVLFGLGAGLGYGLALALATAVPDRLRALAIGMAMAAFASSGIVLPLLLGPLIRAASPPASFAAIGAGMLLAGLLVAGLLRRAAKDRSVDG
ncbi:MAG: MFS transporter, partial [Rhizobiaceae bacterium]|nr:MFS transporter [Rhizobiaceae bacterium]